MDLEQAISSVEKCSGITEDDTIVGEGWAFVLAHLTAVTAELAAAVDKTERLQKEVKYGDEKYTVLVHRLDAAQAEIKALRDVLVKEIKHAQRRPNIGMWTIPNGIFTSPDLKADAFKYYPTRSEAETALDAALKGVQK